MKYVVPDDADPIVIDSFLAVTFKEVDSLAVEKGGEDGKTISPLTFSNVKLKLVNSELNPDEPTPSTEPSTAPSVSPSTAPANTYNAYLCFQTDVYAFRNEWCDATYGMDSKKLDYKTEVGYWGGKDGEFAKAKATIQDAVIDHNGDYTIIPDTSCQREEHPAFQYKRHSLVPVRKSRLYSRMPLRSEFLYTPIPDNPLNSDSLHCSLQEAPLMPPRIFSLPLLHGSAFLQ